MNKPTRLKGFEGLGAALAVKDDEERRVLISLSVSQARAILLFLQDEGYTS